MMDEYQRVLRKNHSLDFDDLLSECVRLFEEHPNLVAGIRHTFVDEFQVSRDPSSRARRDASFARLTKWPFFAYSGYQHYSVQAYEVSDGTPHPLEPLAELSFDADLRDFLLLSFPSQTHGLAHQLGYHRRRS